MKKLFNSRFLFILASSIIVLIGLTIGAFYLFDDVDDSFVKSGYVLNPLSSTSEKYYFEENAGYRENLSSMIEFEDKDKNMVSVLKDSFAHYNDDSMSFLKNGAILDLDSLSGNNVVSFYNITSESIVEKSGNGYVIESSNGDIKLNNFIGRISDDKYIVVGNLNLKVAGNNTAVKGDYFEIVYVEEGIVNVENEDVKYQVAADDTLIYVGDNKIIDLGDKKITLDGKDIMSITAITIDGDENIEIIPKDKEDENDNDGNDEGEGNGENNNQQPNPDLGNNQEQEDGTGNEGNTGEKVKELEVRLKSAVSTSVDITVTFDIFNATEEDLFRLHVVNLSTGVEKELPVSQVVSDYPNNVPELTPGTNYLFSVVNEKDNNKYFQKVISTKTIGVELDKVSATDNSLTFKVNVEENTVLANAKLTLWYFDEEEMKLKPVEIKETDEEGVEITKEYSYYLADDGEKVVGEHNFPFEGLKSNTIYTAVLSNFVLSPSNNTNLTDNYEMSVTAMTLKKTPKYKDMDFNKDTDEGMFKLFIGNIDDPDNAIISYTYKIYRIEKDGSVVPAKVEPIVHEAASPISISVGNEETKEQLQVGKDYYYEVIIEYFDNEKYIDFVTKDRVSFGMDGESYITVAKNDEWIGFNKIGGYIYLTDHACMYPLPDREKAEGEDCLGFTEMYVAIEEVSENLGDSSVNSGEDGILYYRREKITEWSIKGKEIKTEFKFDGLKPGKQYSISVYADGEDLPLAHGENSDKKISTLDFTKFGVRWSPISSSDEEVPIMMNTKLIVNGSTSGNMMDPEESAAAIDKIILRIYDGENVDVTDEDAVLIDEEEFVNTSTFNIKENFFDNEYKITNTDTFGLSRTKLDEKSSDGVLNRNYTITMEAYADGRKIELVNWKRNYNVSPSFFNSAETEKKFEPVSHSAEPDLFKNLNSSSTVIGFDMKYRFDRVTMDNNTWKPLTVNYYVYNKEGKPVDFLMKNPETGELERVASYSQDISEAGFDGLWDPDETPFRIYMDYGTVYEQADDLFTRGNSYYIGFEIKYKVSNDPTIYSYPLANDGTSPSGFGMYEIIDTTKENPNLKMYIASSTKDSITYEYEIKDADNGIYKETVKDDYYFYYIIGNGVQQEIVMEKNNDITEFNQFKGRFTLNGLSNGIKYQLYYKKNHQKTGNITDDVINYLDGSTNTRIFDGYYDASENIDAYRFQYEVINNPLSDNKIVIKIKAIEDVLSRILSYKLTFTSVDENGKVIKVEKSLWKLESCQGDREGTTPRCLSVGYNELRDMKSEENNKKIISIDVEAVYDNGLAGIDLITGSTDNESDRYCILQENSSALGYGRYISFNGSQVDPRDATSDFAIGYNTCIYNNKKKTIAYNSKIYDGKNLSISVKLGASGYYYKDENDQTGVFVNPKMVSIDKMSCSGSNCNGISFDVIVPKVDVKNYKSLLNGAWKKMNLSGININDIKQESDGKRYLYVKVWNTKADAEIENLSSVVGGVYKGEIVGSSSDSSIKDVVVKIDGLMERNSAKNTGKYYFNVYAYLMTDGKEVLTRLPDENNVGFVSKVYELESLYPDDVLGSADVYKSLDGESEYGKRTLNFGISLDNKKELNFDLTYVLCNQGDASCSPNSETSLITGNASLDEVKSGMITKSFDVYKKTNIEFGKNYNINLYANVDYYDPENDNKLTKRTVWLNEFVPRGDLIADGDTYGLDLIDKPSFSADRYTIFDKNSDGSYEYGFKFVITATDIDKTLIDGKYRIKLMEYSTDVSNNSQKVYDESDGIRMVLLDEDGTEYVQDNYLDYEFDASVAGKVVKILGLEESKTYNLVIYGDAYINNYSSNVGETVKLPDGLEVDSNKISSYDKTYPVGTTNKFGVSLGDISLGIDEKSVTIYFAGGFSFDNVTKIRYRILNQQDPAYLFDGYYIIGENNKYINDGTGDTHKSFVIDPKGMINKDDNTFVVGVAFTIKDPETGEDIELHPNGAYYWSGTITK